MNINSILKLLACILLCQSAGLIGSYFTIDAIPTWYAGLAKPFFQPPNWLFGPVWVTLYTLMGISLFLIIREKWNTKIKIATGTFLIHLVFNALWSIIFFGWKDIQLALIVIVIIWTMIILCMALFQEINRAASWLPFPYLLWVSFATLLNLSILKLNVAMSVGFETFGIAALLLLVYMTSWFAISRAANRNDIADTAWGLGFILLSWFALLNQNFVSGRMLIITTLVTLWGIRLSGHILMRNKGKKEDFRYKQWRDEWGDIFILRSFGQVFFLQGLFLYIIILPALYVSAYDTGNIGWIEYIGILIWTTGFFFEAVGDWQISQFIKTKKKGEIMTTGLWKYTRHPNYFGEVTMWWGIFIISLSSPQGYITIVSPLLITFLILKVSGIPMLEKKYAGDKKFEAYKKKTSAFFPLPPKI